MSMSNYTIDDSAWSTPFLALSPGWNMLNETTSHYISPAQVDSMRPLLPTFHEGSYSWNTHAGCSNTITFVGTSITAYGMSGLDSGEYSVVLDGEGRVLTAKADWTDYAHILFTVEGLGEGDHTLTFTNLVEGNWFGFDYAQISTVPASEIEVKPQSAAPAASTPKTKSFNLPDGLLVPAHMLLSGQPTAEQLALLTPYKPHWTPGAYFVVFIAAVSLASLYVFFLFQFAGMLRDKAGEDSCPVKDRREELPRYNAPQGGGISKRFSWESSLRKAARDGQFGIGEGGGAGVWVGRDGAEKREGGGEEVKSRPSDKVKTALRLKQISGPSPIPEEGMSVNARDDKLKEMNTANSEASGSGTTHDDDVVVIKRDKDRDGDSMDGTWPRTPLSFPRLSFHGSSPSSPRHSPKGSPRGTPRGTERERGMKGYF